MLSDILDYRFECCCNVIDFVVEKDGEEEPHKARPAEALGIGKASASQPYSSANTATRALSGGRDRPRSWRHGTP